MNSNRDKYLNDLINRMHLVHLKWNYQERHRWPMVLLRKNNLIKKLKKVCLMSKLAEFTQQMPLKLKWKEILAYDFLCGIFRWSKTGFEGHLWIYCVWIVDTWNSCRTMVALFGTIGNSNTSCRQVATQEQMDRLWKTLYQFSLQINLVHRFMV